MNSTAVADPEPMQERCSLHRTTDHPCATTKAGDTVGLYEAARQMIVNREFLADLGVIQSVEVSAGGRVGVMNAIGVSGFPADRNTFTTATDLQRIVLSLSDDARTEAIESVRAAVKKLGLELGAVTSLVAPLKSDGASEVSAAVPTRDALKKIDGVDRQSWIARRTQFILDAGVLSEQDAYDYAVAEADATSVQLEFVERVFPLIIGGAGVSPLARYERKGSSSTFQVLLQGVRP